MVQLLRRMAGDVRGHVLMIAGAGLFALVGGAGLGIDTIQWYLWKRQLQQAVDAGALAGAHAVSQGVPFESVAQRDLDRNANTAIVVERIARPPASGAYVGNTRAVEVIATTSRVLPFSSLFLVSAPMIRARAVAAPVRVGKHCLISLAKTFVGIYVAGSVRADIGCGIAANSSAIGAISVDGKDAWINASPMTASGTILAASSNYPSDAVLQPHSPPLDDPFASRNLQVPSQPSACTASKLTVEGKQSVRLRPGRYCDGLDIKGTVTMDPGVYIVHRGLFRISGRITGEGVTIVLTGDDNKNISTAEITGDSVVNLRAPTEAEDPYWHDVLFFQDPRGAIAVSKSGTVSSRETLITGGSNSRLQGAFYLPGGDITFTGGSSAAMACLCLVTQRVKLQGSPNLRNSCPADEEPATAATRIRVVE
jgi:Flp pilus assembly protein TadG